MWEVPPWNSQEVPSSGFFGLEVRGEVTGGAHADESVRVQVPLLRLEVNVESGYGGGRERKGWQITDGSEKAMVGSGLQKAVEGDSVGRKVA